MKFHVIETGKFKLDGGAMFGIVPKSIWNRLNPADDHNLCTWSMRCLLVEHDDRLILVDTGMGDKQDAKFKSYFHPHGDDELISSIRSKGFKPEQITDVFITHMHFDHVGGAVKYDETGKLVPTFPHAKYWTSKQHYNWALHSNIREKASFLHENFVPLQEACVLEFMDAAPGAEYKWMDRISFRYYYGHTEAMMLPEFIMDNGKKLIYMADLLPSVGHLRLPYVMAYDIRPMTTLDERKFFWDYASSEGSYLFLEHDPVNEVFSIAKDSKGNHIAGEIKALSDI
jgi:glyoxylase-like metal-dependent hydrolase (beta-lactamase superfamily II)